MAGVLGKLFWIFGLVAIAVVALFYFSGRFVESDDGEVVSEELKETLEGAERTTMEELEKFLDGQESEKKLEGQVGRSKAEGKEMADVEKTPRELESEAIDLNRFLEEEGDTFQRDEGILAEGATDLHQEVMWKIVGDWVYFRICFSPYDEDTHDLMRSPEEAVFLCFNDSSGERVVPSSASARIPMSGLYIRMERDEKVGWAFNGKLSLKDVNPSSLDHSKVGWIFSHELHAHLKNLKELRAQDGRVESQRVSQR